MLVCRHSRLLRAVDRHLRVSRCVASIGFAVGRKARLKRSPLRRLLPLLWGVHDGRRRAYAPTGPVNAALGNPFRALGRLTALGRVLAPRSTSVLGIASDDHAARGIRCAGCDADALGWVRGHRRCDIRFADRIRDVAAPGNFGRLRRSMALGPVSCHRGVDIRCCGSASDYTPFALVSRHKSAAGGSGSPYRARGAYVCPLTSCRALSFLSRRPRLLLSPTSTLSDGRRIIPLLLLLKATGRLAHAWRDFALCLRADDGFDGLFGKKLGTRFAPPPAATPMWSSRVYRTRGAQLSRPMMTRHRSSCVPSVTTSTLGRELILARLLSASNVVL